MSSRAQLLARVGLGGRFLTVGALSTVIEIAVFNLCLLVFGWPAGVAKVVASLVALVNAYFGNREWAFRGRGRHGRTLEAVLFLAVNGVCTVLGVLIVWTGSLPIADPASAHGLALVNVVNLVSIAIVVVVRFLLYHFVVFPGRRSRPGDASA